MDTRTHMHMHIADTVSFRHIKHTVTQRGILVAFVAFPCRFAHCDVLLYTYSYSAMNENILLPSSTINTQTMCNKYYKFIDKTRSILQRIRKIPSNIPYQMHSIWSNIDGCYWCLRCTMTNIHATMKFNQHATKLFSLSTTLFVVLRVESNFLLVCWSSSNFHCPFVCTRNSNQPRSCSIYVMTYIHTYVISSFQSYRICTREYQIVFHSIISLCEYIRPTACVCSEYCDSRWYWLLFTIRNNICCFDQINGFVYMCMCCCSFWMLM